jgi:TRAP-type C4-dicarboxylate transport system permease small subunit
MVERLATFFNRFSAKAHDTGTLIFLPVMIFLITLNVVLRYAFNAPLAWGDEVNGLLLFLVLFLSLTFTWDQKKHIRMEIVYALLKGRMRSLADLATGITGILFFGLMGIQCIRDIPYMIRTNETGEELAIPLWPFRVLMALISFVFVFKLVVYVLHGRKKEGKEEVRIEREGIVIPKEEK